MTGGATHLAVPRKDRIIKQQLPQSDPRRVTVTKLGWHAKLLGECRAGGDRAKQETGDKPFHECPRIDDKGSTDRAARRGAVGARLRRVFL